jgi:hypothetical protein
MAPIVFARGRMLPVPGMMLLALLDIEFLRTRFAEFVGGRPFVLSRRALRGLEEVAPCWCSFC